jgi:hypothetical protein
MPKENQVQDNATRNGIERPHSPEKPPPVWAQSRKQAQRQRDQAERLGLVGKITIVKNPDAQNRREKHEQPAAEPALRFPVAWKAAAAMTSTATTAAKGLNILSE